MNQTYGFGCVSDIHHLPEGIERHALGRRDETVHKADSPQIGYSLVCWIILDIWTEYQR